VTTVLQNVLSFTGLVVGVPVARPHLLNVNGVPVSPSLVATTATGYTITADTVNVTITRTTGGAAVNAYVEHWHTIIDCEPPGGLGALLPFIIEGGGGTGGGGGNEQVFYYTALGNEGDTFVVPLKVPRADANYGALVTLAENSGGYWVAAPTSGFTNLSLTIKTGAPVAAGDKFAILVRDLT
jgi:hypothetical protein